MGVERSRMLAEVARAVPDPTATGAPVRVAIDGVDGAGKTVFAEGRMPGQPAVRPQLEVQVEGALNGLQIPGVGGGSRDVLPGGGVKP